MLKFFLVLFLIQCFSSQAHAIHNSPSLVQNTTLLFDGSITGPKTFYSPEFSYIQKVNDDIFFLNLRGELFKTNLKSHKTTHLFSAEFQIETLPKERELMSIPNAQKLFLRLGNVITIVDLNGAYIGRHAASYDLSGDKLLIGNKILASSGFGEIRLGSTDKGHIDCDWIATPNIKEFKMRKSPRIFRSDSKFFVVTDSGDMYLLDVESGNLTKTLSPYFSIGENLKSGYFEAIPVIESRNPDNINHFLLNNGADSILVDIRKNHVIFGFKNVNFENAIEYAGKLFCLRRDGALTVFDTNRHSVETELFCKTKIDSHSKFSSFKFFKNDPLPSMFLDGNFLYIKNSLLWIYNLQTKEITKIQNPPHDIINIKNNLIIHWAGGNIVATTLDSVESHI